jgi:Domain of unknown function (DUF4224)
MTSPIYLTPQEVEDITGKHRYRAQVRALGQMGIHCWVRPDGRPIVSRLGFERTLNGTARTTAQIEPDFEALHGA